jgi:peptide/nickel transport system ATP-binding protein
MSEALLGVRNLSVAFPTRRGTVVPVKDVSFEIKAGEVLGLVGESGAGKSLTGLSIIGLIEPPGRIAHGEIHFAGHRLDRMPDIAWNRIRGREIGVIFQDPLTSLNPLYSIKKHLTETIRKHSQVSADEARNRAKNLLTEVGITNLEDRAKSYPHEFSGGMRQRVVIALALAGRPKLIIADEPTTALDVSTQAQIIELLKRLARRHQTAFLFISHDIAVIAQIADRVAVMKSGKLVESGPVHDVIHNPTHTYTKTLMACIPPLHKTLSRLPHIGKSGVETFSPPPLETNRPKDKMPYVQVRNLKKYFQEGGSWFQRIFRSSATSVIKAVDDVSFDIGRGQTLALVGESGSGKSTVAKSVAGLYSLTDGSMRLQGQDLESIRWVRSGQSKPAPQIQMIFQDPYASLNPRWRVSDIIAEPIHAFRLMTDQFATTERVHELLEQVGLTPGDKTRYPHEFSGGERQRISIARALSSNPDFIICDEPTSALDVSVQAQILNLMKDLQNELALTYLFISHDLSVVRFMADMIGVMKQGRLVELRSTEDLFAAPNHPYTQRLLKSVPSLEKE